MKTAEKAILMAIVIVAISLVSVKSANALTGPNINLPPSQVTVKVEYPSDTCYYYVQLSNVPEGYHVSNGRFTGWCVDEHHYIYNGQTYSATLYSSYDPYNPHRDPDWPKVNYILNNKKGSWKSVQAAIWYFVDGGTWPSDQYAQAMINAANENGENFVPAPGQTLAVVVWIDGNTQVPIIEVVVPLQNVVPDIPVIGTAGAVTAMLLGLGMFQYTKRKHP